ncbi:unnamed protein product [Camellia sinensis]
MKNRLTHLTKGSKSVEEYLLQIKELFDQWALASSPMDDEDLVLLRLNGLPDEFDALKTTMHARIEPISMVDLTSLLCSESLHIESKQKRMQSHDNTVAYVSMRDSTGGSSSSKGRSSFRSQRGGFRGTFRGGGRQSSRGRGRIYSSPAIICQICGKGNHTALECWHRLDANFHQSLQPNSSSSQSSQVTSSGYTQPRAYVASAPSPSSSEAAPWYLDFAASDHITHDLSNLNLSQSYTGPD